LRLGRWLGHSLGLLQLQSFFDLLEVLLKLALSLSLDIQAFKQLIELVVSLVVEPAVLSVCGHSRLTLLLKQLLSCHLIGGIHIFAIGLSLVLRVLIIYLLSILTHFSV